MKNRRKLKRVQSPYYLKVEDANTNRLIGHLVNISTDGMMLISKAPVRTDTAFKLKMSLPIAAKESKEITFETISRWCMKSADSNSYDVGFQLQDISREDIKVIKKFIRDSWFTVAKLLNV